MTSLRTLSRDDILSQRENFLAVARDVQWDTWDAESFLMDLPEKWELSFAAWTPGNDPVAYAVLSRKSDDRIHLHRFMVSARYRGSGLGKRMVAEMVARAEQAGAKLLTLKAKAGRAAKFYCDNGFQIVGDDGDFIVFQRRVAEKVRRKSVAIHQPNYLPWLGFFHKIACADIFVFLESAQYSKGSYTNRVQILRDGKPTWLTQPVLQKFGQKIDETKLSRADWAGVNINALTNAYKDADAFDEVFPFIAKLLEGAKDPNLAVVNRRLIVELCPKLLIDTEFRRDSDFGPDNAVGDDRLIHLVQACAPNGARYLSGAGGRKYQDEEKFGAAGIELEYIDFNHPVYDQGGSSFVPGLSVLDALFRLGWERTAQVIAGG